MKEEKTLKMRQTDALIIADALRYLANDKERHESDRTSAKVLREKILTVFASSSGSVNVSGEVTGWIPCSERLPGKNGRYLVTYPSLMSYDLQTDVMIYGRPLLQKQPRESLLREWWDDSGHTEQILFPILKWFQ